METHAQVGFPASQGESWSCEPKQLPHDSLSPSFLFFLPLRVKLLYTVPLDCGLLRTRESGFHPYAYIIGTWSRNTGILNSLDSKNESWAKVVDMFCFVIPRAKKKIIIMNKPSLSPGHNIPLLNIRILSLRWKHCSVCIMLVFWFVFFCFFLKNDLWPAALGHNAYSTVIGIFDFLFLE